MVNHESLISHLEWLCDYIYRNLKEASTYEEVESLNNVFHNEISYIDIWELPSEIRGSLEFVDDQLYYKLHELKGCENAED